MSELCAMVDAIGVDRRWLQRPPHASWVHFDISKGKRSLAIKLGAIEMDRYGASEHVARLNMASGDKALVARGAETLARVQKIRERRQREDIKRGEQGDLFA